jgi:hypothetical protein
VKTQQLAGDFMERLRLRNEFEENFTRTLRDLRKELEQVRLMLRAQDCEIRTDHAFSDEFEGGG